MGTSSRFFRSAPYRSNQVNGRGTNTRTIQSITRYKTSEQVKTYVATVVKKGLAKKGMALIDGQIKDIKSATNGLK